MIRSCTNALRGERRCRSSAARRRACRPQPFRGDRRSAAGSSARSRRTRRRLRLTLPRCSSRRKRHRRFRRARRPTARTRRSRAARRSHPASLRAAHPQRSGREQILRARAGLHAHRQVAARAALRHHVRAAAGAARVTHAGARVLTDLPASPRVAALRGPLLTRRARAVAFGQDHSRPFRCSRARGWRGRVARHLTSPRQLCHAANGRGSAVVTLTFWPRHGQRARVSG